MLMVHVMQTTLETNILSSLITQDNFKVLSIQHTAGGY
jgi:hypothetical protein